MSLETSHFQYMHDTNDKSLAVVIPIDEWKVIEEQVSVEDIFVCKRNYWMNV